MTGKSDDAAAELLIREVDEDLRHDRLTQLWKQYGGLAIVAAVGLVLAVAGWQGWSSWRLDQARASSARYSAALETLDRGDADAAAQELANLAADGTDGYRLLAEMKRADLRVQAGDAAGAVIILERIAADGGAKDVYRDLARLKAAYLKLDVADLAELARSVEALSAPASAWRHSAREIQALAAMKAGDAAKAAALFKALADDPAAPQGLRTRAAEILAAGGKN